MRKEYDLSDAVKHPLAGRFNGKFTAVVHYDLNESDESYDAASVEKNAVVAETASEYTQK